MTVSLPNFLASAVTERMETPSSSSLLSTMLPTPMTRHLPHPPILAHAAELLSGYDVMFCDVWGVLHDGHRAFAAGMRCAARSFAPAAAR